MAVQGGAALAHGFNDRHDASGEWQSASRIGDPGMWLLAADNYGLRERIHVRDPSAPMRAAK